MTAKRWIVALVAATSLSLFFTPVYCYGQTSKANEMYTPYWQAFWANHFVKMAAGKEKVDESGVGHLVADLQKLRHQYPIDPNEVYEKKITAIEIPKGLYGNIEIDTGFNVFSDNSAAEDGGRFHPNFIRYYDRISTLKNINGELRNVVMPAKPNPLHVFTYVWLILMFPFFIWQSFFALRFVAYAMVGFIQNTLFPRLRKRSNRWVNKHIILPDDYRDLLKLKKKALEARKKYGYRSDLELLISEIDRLRALYETKSSAAAEAHILELGSRLEPLVNAYQIHHDTERASFGLTTHTA